MTRKYAALIITEAQAEQFVLGQHAAVVIRRVSSILNEIAGTPSQPAPLLANLDGVTIAGSSPVAPAFVTPPAVRAVEPFGRLEIADERRARPDGDDDSAVLPDSADNQTPQPTGYGSILSNRTDDPERLRLRARGRLGRERHLW